MFNWLWGGQPEPPAHALARRLFNKEELDKLQHLFKQHSSGTADAATIIPRLCQWPPTPFTSALAARLVAVLQSYSAADPFTFSSFLVAKAKCEKEGEESAREFALSVIRGCTSGQATAAMLQQALSVCAALVGVLDTPGDRSTSRGPPHPEGEATWQAAVAAGALRQLQASSASSMAGSAAGGAAAGGMDEEGYRKWVQLLPAVHEVLRRLLEVPELAPPPTTPPDASTRSGTSSTSGTSSSSTSTSTSGGPGHRDQRWGAMMPCLAVAPQYEGTRTMLQPHWAWLLASRMPPDHREEWRLLFSSQRDGGSFNTFMARIREAAPTLLLLRDADGRVFGGYAPQEWAKRGAFYGEFSTFIFGLLPEMVIYPATGINSNYQWCGVGFSELPNGVGFGGQPGHFALFLDASFETGISRPAATFANAPLSTAQTFKVAEVECWLLKPPEEEEEARGEGSRKGKKGSILDLAKADQKILELGGVNVNHSAGVRRVDNTPIED